ncbi:unnamed protein product [Orchesella dallaii]|uniref:Carboxylesterase type B domain-containing protein n=1 Tax=Orchesella dallaii TaxID=48710 RepID=A0ABP1R245_9HEXA
MKYRKRQYLKWFWWSSRMIMSSTKCRSRSSNVLSVLISFVVLIFSGNGSFFFINTLGFVKATELNFLSPRVVHTKQGPVQGFVGPGNVGAHYKLQPDGSYSLRHYKGIPVIEIFKGIPFASPPTGNLRYESPSPPPLRSRNHIYSANISKSACPVSYMQILNRTSVPGDPIRALKKTMEMLPDDCLYLDIYAPLTTIYDNIAGNKTRDVGLPVLVYANSQMDDPDDPFDGSSMAGIGNVIVISFHYRVGVLGFVRPGFSDDIRSNFGLWDQLAALQWIKENVEEFGGDPNNICLMGYDLDATLAGLISLSPVSQAYNGLFHRLILLNGSPFSPNSINHQPQKTTFHLARNLKCPLDERSGDLASCFRRTPSPQLFGAAYSIGAPLLTYPFAPIADGRLVPIDVSREDQRHSQPVLDMLGKYDLLCGLKEGPVLPGMGRNILRGIDLSNFVTAAIKLTLKYESDTEPADQLKREVMRAIQEVYGLNPSMENVVSDFLTVFPVQDLLRAHSSTGKNTFFYVFKDFDPLRLNKNNEISYIFSNKVYYWKYRSKLTEYRHLVNEARVEELKPGYGMDTQRPRPNLSTFVVLITLLSNFVRSGDPNVVDPNERFPSSVKPWPRFEKNFGRYLELGQDVEFPSGYRKVTTDFWGRDFPSLLKTFGNQSAGSDSFHFNPFPPNFPPRKMDLDNNEGSFRGSNNVFPRDPYRPSEVEETEGEGDHSDETAFSGISRNTVVLIGALLLLLNFLCFIGLFYQRERLKKTEIQLRRRFLDARQQNPETSQEMETASSFERGVVNNHLTTHHTPARDAMSETETENGFGPDFLGPNYDPRTKVNRWMNMQRATLSKDNSFDNPTPSINGDFHVVQRRDTDLPDPSITVLPLPPPLQPSTMSHSHQSHPPPPLHIQVTSLQRNSQVPKLIPMPIMDRPPSLHILPPLPYQEPYQPSASLVGDIPYADSRCTSPLSISVPTGYCNTPTISVSQPQHQKHDVPRMSGHTSPSPFSVPSSSSSTNFHGHRPGILVASPKESPYSLSPIEPERNAKRTSVLIVRDLDPVDDELERAEPKLVPVKTGTLKRSVGVDTGHDGSPARKESSVENQTGNKRGSSQIRVTFSEKI